MFHLGHSRVQRRTVGRGTIRTVRQGGVFLSGVDRRMHAPLGTVIKFSTMLASRSRSFSSRSHQRFSRVVGIGSFRLLGLVGSVLSFSSFRGSGVAFGVHARSTIGLYGRIIRAIVTSHGLRIRVHFSASLSILVLSASSTHLHRILVGLLIGTAGFARRNSVILRLGVTSISATLFSIASAKYNVPPRGRRLVFRHFRGLGSFIRKDKLNLSVYRLVIGCVGNGL